MICRISPIGNHLHCRCTICASIDGVKRKSRIAERCEKVPGNVTYEQWQAEYIDKIKKGAAKPAGNLPFKRQAHFSTSDENVMATNPNYNLGIAYQQNCQRCVPTYEMRMRGYKEYTLYIFSIHKQVNSTLNIILKM